MHVHGRVPQGVRTEAQKQSVLSLRQDRISPGVQIRSPARCLTFSNKCSRRSKQHELFEELTGNQKMASTAVDGVEHEILPSARYCVRAGKPAKRR